MDDAPVVFWQIALGGPAAFYEAAFSDDELPARFAAPTPQTAREFLILRTLAEVQKYGAAARRWEGEEKAHASGSRFDAVVLESLDVGRAAWRRRLLEALVSLICFSTTNEQEYYHHFLSLRGCDRERRRISDERDFFGAESELAKRRLIAARQVVDGARTQLPGTPNCWYLRSGDNYRESHFRNRYLYALKHAQPAEKTALGYTYDLSFGDASEELHFGVVDSEPENQDHSQRSAALCGLLVVSILRRAHELCSVEPRGINKSVMDPANRDRPISALLSSRAKVGDFILTAGPHLGEVLETRQTPFGYESYRIAFLDDRHGPGLGEDWLPAPAIGMFMSRDEMVRDVQTRIAEHTNNALALTNEELQTSTRAAVREAWDLGLRQYVTRQVESAKQKT